MDKGSVILIIVLSAIAVLGWMAYGGGRVKERRKGPEIKAKDYINMFNNNKKEK